MMRMNPYLMNLVDEVHTDIPIWSSITSSLFTLLHRFKNSKVDYVNKTEYKFNCWGVNVLSKVRLSGILQSFILMFLINASHGQLQFSTDLHLPYVVSSYFLMCPQLMWQHTKNEVLCQIQSSNASFICVASYRRTDVVPVMFFESLWCSDIQSQGLYHSDVDSTRASFWLWMLPM